MGELSEGVLGRGDESARLDWRPWGLGGSDVAAIVGLSPYKSATEVWAQKVGHTSYVPADAIHLRYGVHLESFVACEYERLTGARTHVHAETLRHPEFPYLFGHVDRFVTESDAPCLDHSGRVLAKTLLECKTASAFAATGWGEPWTDQVPAGYLVQCAWYMALSGCSKAHLAVLLGNSDFRVYAIGRDVGLERTLINAAVHFWESHVLTKEPPPAKTREDVTLLHPQEQAGVCVEADGRLISSLRRLERIQRGLTELSAQAQQIREEVAVAMGAAEQLTWGGQTLATWRSSKPVARLDAVRLRREQPDLAKAYTIESAPARRLVIGGARHE